MKKIIVTGATSMLGAALIDAAVAENTEVYAIIRPDTSRLERIISSPRVHIFYGTLDNMNSIKGIPQDCDVFYHFAWMGTQKLERDNPIIQEKNIKYTIEAVELASKCGCKKFVGAGSQAEYGPTDGVIDNDSRFLPETAYGISKLAAGFLSRNMCEKIGLVHIWGRIFSVYGPHDNEGTMLRYAIGQFLDGKEAIFSSATQQWNYLYESDAGRIFYLLGEKVDHSSSFRIAHKHSQPLRKYIEVIKKTMGTEGKCKFDSESDAKNCYGIETCDDMLFKAIGYEPQVSFEEGIKLMIEQMKKSS